MLYLGFRACCGARSRQLRAWLTLAAALSVPLAAKADPPAAPPTKPAEAPQPAPPAPQPTPDVAPAPEGPTAAPADETAPADTPPAPEPDLSVAAEPAPVEETPAAPAANGGELGEIVVTANRRETSLQKYAGAATAMTQEDLDRKGIKSVREVANATPSVEIGTQESNVEIYIRGVGTDYNTELGDPTVATHIDGVYIPRPRGVGSMLFDMERLEISRGPQGTLRGRNAVGGSLNLITAKPVLQEWLGEASWQMGNYSQRLGRGMVNVPIGEKLALRVAAFGETRDPFYKNAGSVYTIAPAESSDTLAYRATLLAVPVQQVKITLAHDFTQEKGTGYSGSNYNAALTSGILPEEIPDPRAVLYRGPQLQQKLRHWGMRGNVDVDLGPVQIEYIGSYRNLGYKQVTGGNAGVAFPGRNPGPNDADDWGSSYWDTASKSMVHELRLYAPNTSRVRWTVGGFLFDERQRAFLGSAVDNASGYFGNEFNMPSVKNHSYAGFADAIIDIMANWRASAGARLSTEAKERDGIGYSYAFMGLDPNARFGTEGFRFKGFDRTDYTATPGGGVQDFLGGIASFGARDTLSGQLGNPGVMIDESRLQEQHGKYSATFVDFRVGTDYDLTRDNMLYAQFANAHKSGGFNDNIVIGGVSVAPSYKPETIYSTEIGSKNKFLDGNLVANFTGFWYHYVNQQFKAIQEISAPGAVGQSGASTAVMYNAANSRVLGLEAELAARLPYGLRADVAGTLLDARFTSGEIADVRLGWDPKSQPMTPLDGNLLPRAPQLSVNYGVSQQLKTSFGKFDWSISAQTRSIQYMTVFNGEGKDNKGNVNANLSDKVPSYTRVDINVGYTIPNGRLRVDAFVLNLTDVIYMTSLINTPNLNLRFFNPPRQIGARLTVQL